MPRPHLLQEAERVEARFGAEENSSNMVSNCDSASDAVVEQWYTDPYYRVDPNGCADNQIRATNIYNALRNQGFSFVHSAAIVNWLIRCDGRFQPFQTRQERRAAGVVRRKWKGDTAARGRGMGRGRGGSATGRTPIRFHTPSLKPMEQGQNSTPNSQPSNGKDNESDFFGNNSNGDEDEADRLELDKEEQKLKKILSGMADDTDETQTPNSAFPTIFDPFNHDAMIHALRNRLRFWDIIYGKQLPRPNPAVSFDYTVTPIPRAIIPGGLHTQNHLPLQHVLVNNISTLTEDPTFGITQPPPAQTLTLAQQDAYIADLRRERERTEREEMIRRFAEEEKEAEGRELVFSNGYREVWKEALARREREKREQDGGVDVIDWEAGGC